MKCVNCGKRIRKELKFCPYCDASQIGELEDVFSNSNKEIPKPLILEDFEEIEVERQVEAEEENSQEAETKKKFKINIKLTKKAKQTLLGIAAGLLVVLILWACGVFKSNATRIKEHLEVGEFDAAYSLYLDKYSEKENPKRLVKVMIKYMKESYSLHIMGELPYEHISESLSVIEKMDVGHLDDTLNYTVTNVEQLKNSEEAFILGGEYYKDKKYTKAIAEYRKVSKDYKYYESAKTGLENSISAYRNSVLSTAADYAYEGEYTKAIKALDKTKKILPEDDLIAKRKEDYRQAKNRKLLKNLTNEIDRKIVKKDYKGAIEVITKAIKKDKALQHNTTLIRNLKYYRQKYKRSFTNKYSEYTEYGYFAARDNLLLEAYYLLPGDDFVKSHISDIKDKLPKSIEDLKAKNKKNWRVSKGSALDTNGYSHTDDESYIVMNTKSKATYNVGNYSKISFYIIAGNKMDSKGTLKLLTSRWGIETEKKVTVKTYGNAKYVEFDLSGCDELKFSLSGKDAWVILYDIQFHK